MIRTLIVDDHEMFRQGVSHLLDSNSDVEVVGQATDGRDAVRQCRDLTPDVVLMDIAMQNLNGVDATRQIVEEQPSVRVIGVSAHVGTQMITQMLRAGAAGYVPKRAALDELLNAIRAVSNGDLFVSQLVASDVILAYIHGDVDSFGRNLTPREREVLQLVAEGNNTKRIADMLHVSVKTVETHRKHLMDKLNLPSVAQLTRYAILEGISPLNL